MEGTLWPEMSRILSVFDRVATAATDWLYAEAQSWRSTVVEVLAG